MENSERPILLVSGHLRPLRTIIGQLPAVLFGAGFLWLAALADWRDLQHFFLWLLLVGLGVASLGWALFLIACAVSGYPKIVLMDGWLISFGLSKRTLNLNLSEYGEAEVVQFGRWTQTALAFHSSIEEAAIARAGLSHPPTALNAAKLFPLTYSVGNDFQKAQEIADQINDYRTDYIKPVDLHGADVERVLGRKMNAHIWSFCCIVGAAIIVALILKILLPG